MREAAEGRYPIVIDAAECTGCGLCVTICHEHCLSLTGNIPRIDRMFCSTCAQCIAICPPKVFSWDHVAPVRFETGRLPSTEQLDELFGERHSIRHFKRTTIDRALLSEVVAVGTYAPTEDFHLRVIAIDDEEIIAQLDRALFDLTVMIHRRFFKLKLIGQLARLMGFSHMYQRTASKVQHVIDRGHALITRPAAFLFVVGDKRLPLSRDSAQYAVANMMYAALARRLGTCLCGNGPMYFDKDKTIRKRLALGKRQNILGALMLGYSELKFSNKVMGKALPIEWNGVIEPAAGGKNPAGPSAVDPHLTRT